MESINDKQPLLADPEQLAYQQLVYQSARQADRRRRVARRLKLAAVAVALVLFFSSTSSFGFFSTLLSSIIPALGSPSRPLNPGPSSPNTPSSPPSDSPVGISLSTPLEGPLVLPDNPLCSNYNDGNGLKTYPLATYPVVFDGQHSFAFRQNATRLDEYDDHWRHVRISGEVVVRKATAGKEPSVDVEALSNDDRIRAIYAYDRTESRQSLQVTIDERIRVETDSSTGHIRGQPCIVVRATVWLPDIDDSDSDVHTTHLENLLIANTHLGIQLIDDTNLVVDKYARLTSVIGSIAASRAISPESQKAHWHSKPVPAVANSFGADYRFEAPETDVETTSSPISGPWTLLDRLHFGSVSGSVHVAIAPEASSADKGGVADLSFQTTSGPISFEEIASPSSSSSGKEVYPHTLSVSSRSGTIHASGSFARNARLHSTSGPIKASLLPVALDENSKTFSAEHQRNSQSESGKATLDSNTVSGSTEIFLLDEPTGKPLDFLKSAHTAVSGALRLHYPASWAGGIHLKSLSSSVAVKGKGVHVLPDNSPHWPPRVQRRIEATKDVPESDGDGSVHTELSNVVAETVSGSVRLDFPL